MCGKNKILIIIRKLYKSHIILQHDKLCGLWPAWLYTMVEEVTLFGGGRLPG